MTPHACLIALRNPILLLRLRFLVHAVSLSAHPLLLFPHPISLSLTAAQPLSWRLKHHHVLLLLHDLIRLIFYLHFFHFIRLLVKLYLELSVFLLLFVEDDDLLLLLLLLLVIHALNVVFLLVLARHAIEALLAPPVAHVLHLVLRERRQLGHALHVVPAPVDALVLASRASCAK